MVEDKFSFPIGSLLKEILIIEDREFGGDELCFDRVRLIFNPTSIIVLEPLTDTDEISISSSADKTLLSSSSSIEETPTWGKSFISKKLQAVWLCKNDQGYLDQIIFAFDQLHPSLAFISEGSVLKVFCYEQIKRTQTSLSKLKHSQV